MAGKKGGKGQQSGGGPPLWAIAGAGVGCVGLIVAWVLNAPEAGPAAGSEAEGGVVALSVLEDLSTLNGDVFSSTNGDPWLVWCSDSAAATEDGSAPGELLEALAGKLEGVAQLAKLDCSEALPSGKTIYTKLSLDSSQPPVVFLSPKQGKRPQQLPPSKLNLQSLERIVMKVTAPVMRVVEDEEGLGMHCLRKPWCAVLLSHGELSESHRADAEGLMAQFGRKVAFVTLDGGRYRLNTQPRILKKGEPSRSVGAPRVLLFHREALEKEGQFALHAAIDRSGDLSEGGGAAEMISGALAEPGALAHTLREAPTLVDRGEQKQAVREERKAKRAEATREREAAEAARAKERERRAEMDREAAESLGIESTDEPEQAGEGAAGGDGGWGAEEAAAAEQEGEEEEEEGGMLSEELDEDEDEEEEDDEDDEEEVVLEDDD